MPHITFLIKSYREIDSQIAMRPETVETFEMLRVSLAGRVP